jgi:hypothetical protein
MFCDWLVVELGLFPRNYQSKFTRTQSRSHKGNLKKLGIKIDDHTEVSSSILIRFLVLVFLF